MSFHYESHANLPSYASSTVTTAPSTSSVAVSSSTQATELSSTADSTLQSRRGFSSSSININLSRTYGVDRSPFYILRATCYTQRGRVRASTISLSNALVNEDGYFRSIRDATSQSKTLGASAKDVRLAEKGRVLEAKLQRNDGTWRDAKVDLDALIVNNDGELRLDEWLPAYS